MNIDDPPDTAACASCSSPLSWLYSARRKAWISVVPVDRTTMRLHGCRHSQDPATWRELRRGDPPNDEYLAAKSALREATGEHPDMHPICDGLSDQAPAGNERAHNGEATDG